MWHQYPEGYLLNLSTRITARRRTDAATSDAVRAPDSAVECYGSAGQLDGYG